MVFECGFEFDDKVGEGTHDDGHIGDGILLKGGCPGKCRSFGHVGRGESDHLTVGIVDLVVDKEVEVNSVHAARPK